VPVSVRGATSQWVTVRPGDFVLGDEDGVLIIPGEVVNTVLVEAERLTEKERLIRTELQQGLSLAEALAKFGHV
jgi:4-hydroxy-4-methyl-2-oxoglutarate aldolase